ncbi:hypothetical protein HDU98_010422 [Podochytrium sp. JEL0797]|nr:hypothetical protein HDU98_010422 [Podochytrium sp. JEL0797]
MSPRSGRSRHHPPRQTDTQPPNITPTYNYFQSTNDETPLFSITSIIPAEKPKPLTKPTTADKIKPAPSRMLNREHVKSKIGSIREKPLDLRGGGIKPVALGIPGTPTPPVHFAEAAEPWKLAHPPQLPLVHPPKNSMRLPLKLKKNPSKPITGKVSIPKPPPNLIPIDLNSLHLHSTTKHPVSRAPPPHHPRPQKHHQPSPPPTTPSQIQITWDSSPLPPETTREYLLETPIEAWRSASPSDSTAAGSEDPDTCRALAVGEGNGTSYNYFGDARDGVDLVRPSTTGLVKRRGGQLFAFGGVERPWSVPGAMSARGGAGGVYPQIEEADGGGNELADSLVEPLELLTESETPILPSIKIFSHDYLGTKAVEPTALLPQEGETEIAPACEVPFPSDLEALFPHQFENSGLSTITIRNWQLQQQEPDKDHGGRGEQHAPINNASASRDGRSIKEDIELNNLPTLGSIGLIIKPLVPAVGLGHKIKKDAVWGYGGTRRSDHL